MHYAVFSTLPVCVRLCRVLFSRVRIALCSGNLGVTHPSYIRWGRSRRRLTERRCHTFISLTLRIATSGLCALQWITDRRCNFRLLLSLDISHFNCLLFFQVIHCRSNPLALLDITE